MKFLNILQNINVRPKIGKNVVSKGNPYDIRKMILYSSIFLKRYL